MDFQKPDYTYRVPEVLRVIDGDTVDILIDLGFYTTVRKRVRLLGVDADEPRGGTEETKERARAATLRLESLLDSGKVYIKTKMDAEGKYGRVLGWLFVEREKPIYENGVAVDGGPIISYETEIIDVSQILVDEGFEKGEENTSIVNKWINKLFGG